jgi:hypothetical protein
VAIKQTSATIARLVFFPLHKIHRFAKNVHWVILPAPSKKMETSRSITASLAQEGSTVPRRKPKLKTRGAPIAQRESTRKILV